MPFKNPHPLYATWQNMKSRCSNQNLPNYGDYGGRGITVCDRWIESFPAFVEDMGDRPRGTSIDRIDNNGPYSPENCRWATRIVQSRNQRNTRYVSIEGISYRASDLSDRSGLKTDTIVARAKMGLLFKEVMDSKPRVYEIKKHSGDTNAVARRIANSRSRTACKNGHPWPEFQRLNSRGAVECSKCSKDKMDRYKAKRR